jgi:hypothetical protein
MDFSIGIVTNTTVNPDIIDSIVSQNIPNFEIIIVGGENTYNEPYITHIPFDESILTGWITRKKNLITYNALYENIVYIHDYYQLEKDWYVGFESIGNEWDVCMTKVINLDNTRFRDWCVWDDPSMCYPNGKHRIILPTYTYTKVKYMYISGGYWIAKKTFMIDNPLDETLKWGESEDVEWSKRIRDKCKYSMNIYSRVKTIKQKKLSATLL